MYVQNGRSLHQCLCLLCLILVSEYTSRIEFAFELVRRGLGAEAVAD